MESLKYMNMDFKLCRTCGKAGINFINIFRTEGLKTKLETCLSIVVSEHSLLPHFICPECLSSIENFYVFKKCCLQNIIILENHFNTVDSCLKTKQRQEKSCQVSLPEIKEISTQTENVLVKVCHSGGNNFQLMDQIVTYNGKSSNGLVNYSGVDSESSGSENPNDTRSNIDQVTDSKKLTKFQLFDDLLDGSSTNNAAESAYEGGLVLEHCLNDSAEIQNMKKRKSNTFNENFFECEDNLKYTSKKKRSSPNKCDKSDSVNLWDQTTFQINLKGVTTEKGNEDISEFQTPPQRCDLCSMELTDSDTLIEHIKTAHTIQDVSHQNETLLESQKDSESHTTSAIEKYPSLWKIFQLKHRVSFDISSDCLSERDEFAYLKPVKCPNCSVGFTTKTELFVHLKLKHSEISTFICGICLNISSSAGALKDHVSECRQKTPATHRYFCQICYFGDDNHRSMESHVLVHNFLWKDCQREIRNFDPEDYIQLNPNFIATSASPIKYFSCLECYSVKFDSFRKFSEHRREFHSVFHCDLCNKFYSRNASLRKHANTAHKGHPSITCQICMKTKASKYHLAQHFADIHQLDNTKIPGLQNVQYENHDVAKENIAIAEIEPQLLRDSAKQDLMEKTTKNSFEQNQSKELDADHDDENNVPLTNHSSQKIEEFKCPHCSKGFHNKLAMVKHETTCELRNQKAPTCNICSKIFKNKDTLLKHHTRCHSEYECEICNKKITGKCEIIRHIRFQHPSSYLECKLCKSILRNKKDLLHHLEDHENSFICQFCGDCLTSKIKIRMHILGLHGKILSLSCSICLKMFDTQQVLRDHVNLTHKDRVTSKCSCPVCGKNYCSKWTTFDHINRTHGEVFKACKICLDLFESEPELHNHLQLTHNIQSMETNISAPTKTAGIVANQVKCQKTSKGEQSDYQHDNGSEEQHDEHILEIRCTENEGPKNMKDSASSTKVNKEIGKTKAKKRKVYDNNDVPGTCEFCHKTCPSRKHLWQHCLRYHKEGAATVCGICLKSMPNYEELQMHLREEHPLLLYGQGCGSKFICQICGRYHNSSSKLEKHMIVHEKFDWKIMDRFPPLPKFNYNKNQMAKIRDACSQLQAPDKEQKGVEHLEAIEDINEALIEQVTESSCESEIES